MFSLSVITELDGLAKGQDNFGGGMGSSGRNTGSRGNYNVSVAHLRAVQEKARLAVAFLEKGFEAREPCLRALTSRGNQLESIAFRSEDTSGQQVRAQINVAQKCLFHYYLISLGNFFRLCNEMWLFLVLGNWLTMDKNAYTVSVTQFSILCQGNNDDVILSCCLHYCKDKAKDFMPNQRSM